MFLYQHLMLALILLSSMRDMSNTDCVLEDVV